MEATNNRLERELEQWQKREQRFIKLFTPQLLESRAFLKEKLRHLERLSARYGNTNDMEERLALRLLKQERSNLEKQMYPNRLLRIILLAVKGFAIFTEPIIAEQRVHKNTVALKASLEQAGFGKLKERLEQTVQQGQEKFSLPVSYYVNEKERMDFQVHFTKGKDEQYRLSHYDALLYSENHPGKAVKQTFPMDTSMSITSEQAYNLLSGRAVLKESEGRKEWVKLDLNDKDGQGIFRMKRFPENYGYDPEKELDKLPLKETQGLIEKEKLLRELANGNRVEVTLRKGGQKLLIEAEPQKKTVNIYTIQGEKLTIGEALGRKQERAARTIPLGVNRAEHTNLRKNSKKGLKI